MKSILATAAALLSAATAANAATSWTDWNNYSAGIVAGTMDGVVVTYSGSYAFAQTAPGQTNYWVPASTYMNAIVTNAPDTTDIVALAYSGGTLNFSQPVTNPVMAIVSLGGGVSTSWNFDAPFNILTNGPGYWGNGPMSNPTGNTLLGTEAHGMIQFQGTFSSISWTIENGESWAGFTVGVVPAPGAASLGLASAVFLRRRRR